MSLGTDNATAEFIQGHLDDDLEEVAQQPNQTSIRPSLTPFLTPDGLLTLSPLTSTVPPAPSSARLVLQVVAVKDVSLSRDQRCRALVRAADLANGGTTSSSSSHTIQSEDAAAVVDATLQAMEEQNDEAAQQHAPLRPSGGQWRCLRLELTDGFHRILAVEDVGAARSQFNHQNSNNNSSENNNSHQYTATTVFAPNGLALGAKVAVQLTTPSDGMRPVVQHGVLRLHGGNAEVLGGRVRALEVYWEAQARQHLAAITGRPSRHPQQPQPPPQQQQQWSQHSSPQPPHIHRDNSNDNSAQRSPAPPGQPSSPSPPRRVESGTSSPSAPLVVQPLRQWPRHVAQHPPQTPFLTVAFITEVVSDMVINEPAPSNTDSHNSHNNSNTFTYALLAQLSSPDAVERETQQQQGQGQTQPNSTTPAEAVAVTEDDHLTVDLGHAWLQQLVGMPAEHFRALSLSTAPADVARLTQTVEAVGQALEQFGRGRFTLVQRASDGIVEVVKAEPER